MWTTCASSAVLAHGGFAMRARVSRRRRPCSETTRPAPVAVKRVASSFRGWRLNRAVAEGGVVDAGVVDDDEIPTTSDVVIWRVRNADEQDVDAVVRLASDSGVDWTAGQISEEVRKGNTMVAVPMEKEKGESSSQIAGFVVAWAVGGVEVQILEVATRPETRRQGVASQLIQKVLDTNPRLDAFLECRLSNEPALGLYMKKFGFQNTGTRKKYYANGEDAALLTRSPPTVSARELTRLLAGLSPEDARLPPSKTPEEKQRGTVMHAQDYPRKRPAFVRNKPAPNDTSTDSTGRTTLGGFKMRNRVRK
jgi:ribosomal-protein-alanine N-acetyltransferase